jgi:hypothetical protein
MKETKRERELRLLKRQIARMEVQREAAIGALVRAETALPGLRKQLERKSRYARLQLSDRPLPDTGIVEDPLSAPAAHVAEDGGTPVDVPTEVDDHAGAEMLARQLDDGLAIPSYLDRTALNPDVAAAAYAVANAHNAPPTPEQKKLVATEKRKVREERKQAKLTGKTRKWPATGREARALLK